MTQNCVSVVRNLPFFPLGTMTDIHRTFQSKLNRARPKRSGTQRKNDHARGLTFFVEICTVLLQS